MAPRADFPYIWAMNFRKKALPALLAAALPLASPATGAAQQLVSTGQSFMTARLVDGGVGSDGARMVGIVLDLTPGWKTYWRTPGEAGVPPQFDWSRSTNLKHARIQWPRPKFFDSLGMTTLGYTGQVVFPVRVEPKDPGKPVDLSVKMDVGVCHDICVMEQTTAALTVGPQPEANVAGAALIREAEAKVPKPAVQEGMTGATCTISGSGTRREFDATLDFGRTLPDAKVILEGPEMAWFEDIKTTEKDGKLHVSAALSLMDQSVWVNRSDLRMTVLAGDMAADVKGCEAPAG